MSIESLGWKSTFDESFAPYRASGLIPARVAREDKERYHVLYDSGELLAEVSGKFRHRARTRTDFPVVGDWVAVAARPDEGKGIIEGVLPRTSIFCRKVAGTTTEEQPVAANISFAFLLTGLDSNFNLRRIERYLTVCYDGGASPVILLTKADLCEDVDAAVAEVEAIALGVPIHPISNITGDGLDDLDQYFGPGLTIALFGSSGVGKSTLINRLLGDERLLTNEVRYDGLGRHTTSWREMILLPSGGVIIDTPGMKELGLWADESSLAGAFEDIDTLAATCRFRDCTHASEPGCAVQEAVASGILTTERLESYFKLRKELAFLARKEDRRARLAEKARWKQIAVQIRAKEKFEKRG